MSMSQPAISCGVASRPMPSRFAGSGLFFGAAPRSAVTPNAISAQTPQATRPKSLRDFDILDLAALVQMPRLDAVVVIDRVDAAYFTKFALARLHVAGLVHRTRLDQQLAAVPVELVVEARQRFVPHRAVD